MRRTALIVVAAALVLALAPVGVASARDVPSFARWAVQWKRASDRAINAALDPCQKHFVDNGVKAGECTVRNVRLVFVRVRPIWNRAVDRVARGQSVACRAAIHSYWLTTRTQQSADLAYLAGHAHVSVTQMNIDLSTEPFTTMNRIAANAKLHAIQVCG